MLKADNPHIYTNSPTAAQNANLIVRFFAEVLATGDAANVSAFLAAGFIDYDATPHAPAGVGALIQKLTAMWHSFPDGRFMLETVIAADDRVAAKSIFTGTQRGPFDALEPTGRCVRVTFSDWYRIADGKIAEHWHNFDETGLMRQLGVKMCVPKA